MKATQPRFESASVAIQAVIADYFAGIHFGDVERLRRVFHPKAVLHGDLDGETVFRTLDDYLEVVRNRRSPHSLGEPLRMTVLSIECVNGIASVRARCPMLGFDYLDILSLIHAEGSWRIVSKLFTHPAWAPSISG
jgi:hypothetical protein